MVEVRYAHEIGWDTVSAELTAKSEHLNRDVVLNKEDLNYFEDQPETLASQEEDHNRSKHHNALCPSSLQHRLLLPSHVDRRLGYGGSLVSQAWVPLTTAARLSLPRTSTPR